MTQIMVVFCKMSNLFNFCSTQFVIFGYNILIFDTSLFIVLLAILTFLL